MDDFDEFGAVVAALAAELDELGCFCEQGAALGCAGDADAVSRAELEESFVAQQPQGAQHGVGVDVHDGCEMARGWEAFTGFGFAVGDRAADLCGDLVVQEGWVVAVDLDIDQCASHSSATDHRITRIDLSHAQRMTLTTEQPPPEAPDAGVIKEARARQRRHRRVFGVAVAALMAGLVTYQADGGAPPKPSPTPNNFSSITPVVHGVSFRSPGGPAEASFAMHEPAGVILLAQISAPRGVRAVVDATNPFGGSARIATIADRRDPSRPCRLRGGVNVCTQAYEACPLVEATWRFHIVKLSGPAGPVRVDFIVGARPSQT